MNNKYSIQNYINSLKELHYILRYFSFYIYDIEIDDSNNEILSYLSFSYTSDLACLINFLESNETIIQEYITNSKVSL